MKLNVKAFAIALGLVWGLCLLFVSWTSCYASGMSGMFMTMKSMYVGMDSTFIGGVAGFAWGFVAGAIHGGLIAYFYNRLVGGKKK